MQATNNADAYLKFDLANAAWVTSAKLRLYAKVSTPSSLATTVFAVPNPAWNETSLTWNNKPGLGAVLSTGTVLSNQYAWTEIDVTAYVRDEAVAKRPIVSFALHNTANDPRFISAHSREAANKPQLVVITNTPPTVTFIAPTENQVFAAPAQIALSATAVDSDGSVSKVEYYHDATLVATHDGPAPFTATWSNVSAGPYTLTAKATDNQGAFTSSSPVSIIVDTPPTVSLISPGMGSIITAPANLTLTAQASDSDDSVTRVDYYHEATLIGSSTGPAPYSVAWNNLAAGTYTLTARATDSHQLSTTSSPVTVTVNAPPAVNIDLPSDGAIFIAPASITLTAQASDSDGTIDHVAFYHGANPIGTRSTAPFSFTWNTVDPGSYVLSAMAFDNHGASTLSPSVSITVRPNTPPTVTLTHSAPDTPLPAPATVILTADALDSDGSIVRVEFYNDTTLLGTASTPPFTYTWQNVGPAQYTLYAKAIDNGGASTTSPSVTFHVVSGNVTPGVYYVYPDHLNTPRVITDSANNVVWRYNSDAFGNGPPNEDADANGTAFTYNLRFPGQYFDQETGLFYNYYRDYDSRTGRYVQSDPIGLEGGLNTYNYVRSNPLNFVDPYGLNPATAAEGAAIGFGIGGPPGAVVGGIIGFGLGAWGTYEFWNWYNNENANNDGGDSCPVPDTSRDRITRGNTDIRTKPGNADTANGDFDALNPTGVSDKGNGVRVGTLGDGSTVVVRPSTDGRPTIEIQAGGRTRIKIRYDE